MTCSTYSQLFLPFTEAPDCSFRCNHVKSPFREPRAGAEPILAAPQMRVAILDEYAGRGSVGKRCSRTQSSVKAIVVVYASTQQFEARPQPPVAELPSRFPKMSDHSGAPGAISFTAHSIANQRAPTRYDRPRSCPPGACTRAAACMHIYKLQGRAKTLGGGPCINVQ